jgi:hypothetical protein
MMPAMFTDLAADTSQFLMVTISTILSTATYTIHTAIIVTITALFR